MEAAIAKHIDPSNLLIERAVAEWDGDEKTCFLGDEANSSFNMTVGLDPSTDKLLLWFQLVVSVKRHRAATHSRPRSLFMLLQADMFDHDHDPCFSLNPVSEMPAPKATLEAISRASLGGDNTRTFRLHLRLKEHSQVVMPKSDPPLIPATEKSRRLLRSFRSLSDATSLSVYVPLGTDRVQSLQDVCNSLLSKQLVNHDIGFESFYTGGAERDVWSNFDIFLDSVSEHQAPKVDVASNPTTSSPLQGSSFERKGTKAVEAAEDEGASAEPVPPPQYEGHDASAAKQPNPSLPPDPASPLLYRPELDLDGETTEEDEEPPIEQAPASPHSPPRKKRKADNNSPAEPAASTPALPPLSPHAAAAAPPPEEEGEETEAAASPLPPYPSSSRPHPHNKPRVRFTSTSAPTPTPTPSTQQKTISSHHNTTPSSLRAALARFLRWLAAVDVDLQDKYDGLLWDMGDAAAAGDGVKFYRLQARCKAEVLVGYRRRREPVAGGTGEGGEGEE